ncbi:phage tail assembly chaperone [Erythrobacter sp. NE805]|uniref:phage tail assembly chaperone n=1 Tax=Erythrobacter sp. NE805 TaxID=3389875 RepID=UPI00396B05DE
MKIYFDIDPETGAVRFHHEAILGARQIPQWSSEEERAAGKRPVMVDNPDCLIPAGAAEISAARFEELMAAQREGAAIALRDGKPVALPRDIDPDQARAVRRQRRDQRLAASDWTQLPDAPLSEEAKAAWAAYRQALRDLDMDGSDWPEPPAS